MATAKKRMSDAWTILFVFGGFTAICLAIGMYMMRLQGGAAELQKANPVWTVERMGNAPLRVDDGSPAGEIFIADDDAGPSRIERIDCAEVRQAFPAWFHLPDAPIGNCARLGDAAPFTLVLNLRTATTIPALWEELYKPTVERLGLTADGGWMSGSPSHDDKETLIEPGNTHYAPSPPGGPTNRYARALHYVVELGGGSAGRKLAIDAFYYGDSTLAVFTFRPELRP